MRIRAKISLLASSVFLSAILISTLSIWTTNEISRLKDTIQSGFQLISAARQMHGLMKDLMFDLFAPRTYLLLKDLLHTPRFQTTRQDLRTSVQSFESSFSAFMDSPRVKALLREEELRDAYGVAKTMTAKASGRIESFQRTMDRLFASGNLEGSNLYMQLQTGGDTSIPLFFEELRETSYYLTYSFESFLAHFITSLQREAAAIQRQILILFWTLTGAIGSVTLALAILFSRRISGQLKRFEEGFRAVSHGDFSVRLDIRSADEFGALAGNYNLFMTDLKRNVESIQGLLRDVGESLTTHLSFQRILELIVEAAVKNSNAGGAAVVLPSAEERLVVECSAGVFPHPSGTSLPRYGGGSNDGGVSLNEIYERRAPIFIREPKSLDGGPKVSSLQAFPLIVSQRELGLLCLITADSDAPLTDLDFNNFRTFTEYAELIIDNFFKYKELLEKREAQYRALQSQIQPHFLYNVLNGLVGLNRMGDARALESAIFSLKDMLRYILDKGNWTTVAEELRFLERYCELQRMRFPDRLKVSIRCAEEVESFRIPKLILQPVVENAVIHGIEPLGRPAILSIEAGIGGGEDGQFTSICIADDGAGFDPEATDVEQRIGLSNVRERLLMAYPNARLSISSSPGSGTRIRIEIPSAEGKREDPDRG
jgi:sensor histidine kinase YesM